MKDVNEVKARIIKLRGWVEEQVLCRLHIDKGGKTLKFSFSLVNLWEQEEEAAGWSAYSVVLPT